MAKGKLSPKELILKLLREKSALKQDIFQNIQLRFGDFKKELRQLADELRAEAVKFDNRISIEYKERSVHEVELLIAGDLLIFHMHTNVFEFDKNHPVWKSSYVKENPYNSYCGMIVVYNFLADSFKYNRVNDIGYLIARIFINKENHFFVEGKRQLGFLYNDFVNSTIDKDAIRRICESTILYALDFDLLTPPFEAVKEVSVSELLEAANQMQLKTGKRLGFRFQADTDQFE
ncbi:MAG: hypothetical protein AB1458_08000 [Bacteroidota bacterium]